MALRTLIACQALADNTEKIAGTVRLFMSFSNPIQRISIGWPLRSREPARRDSAGPGGGRKIRHIRCESAGEAPGTTSRGRGPCEAAGLDRAFTLMREAEIARGDAG